MKFCRVDAVSSTAYGRENMTDFENILNSDEFFADPYPTYGRLREEAPVYWSENWSAWVLTRYDDVMQVLRQSERFSSAGRVRYLLDTLPDSARQQVKALERHYDIGLAHSDPPDHTRLRNLLNRVFTPRMVENWRERIETVTNELLDAVEPQGTMDIIHDLAYPLPATIIAEMIGAPNQDIAYFREWAVAINRLFEQGGRMSEQSAKAAQDSLYEMRDYIAELSEIKRQNPSDDILGRLVSAEADEDKLTIGELVSTCVTFFVAGHETTTNLIGNGMLALLQHPEQLDKLKNNPELIHSAIEEMLRYNPSVPRGWRITKEDVTLRGQTIKQGSLVFPILSSANRDPLAFPDPDSFDIERNAKRHLAFGYGIHFCLGAPLARLEGAIVINTLLQRFPNIQLASDTVTWRRDIAIRSLDNLPVTLT